MGTIIDLMRIAALAVYGLFVARSGRYVHPALILAAPRGVFAWSGGRNQRQRARDASFTRALSVVGCYTGFGSGPP